MRRGGRIARGRRSDRGYIGTGGCSRLRIGGRGGEIEPRLVQWFHHFRQWSVCRRKVFRRGTRPEIIVGRPCSFFIFYFVLGVPEGVECTVHCSLKYLQQ